MDLSSGWAEVNKQQGKKISLEKHLNYFCDFWQIKSFQLPLLKWCNKQQKPPSKFQMEELPGRASSIHRQRGTTRGCTSAWRRWRKMRMKVARILMSPWSPQMLERGYQPSPGCLRCNPPATLLHPSWFPHLSFSCHTLPPLAPWKRVKAAEAVFGTWDPP